MMVCILNGFEDGKFDLHHVASNFKDWFEGIPMGIGSHTYKVLCMGDYVEQPEMCSKLWWDLSRYKLKYADMKKIVGMTIAMALIAGAAVYAQSKINVTDNDRQIAKWESLAEQKSGSAKPTASNRFP